MKYVKHKHTKMLSLLSYPSKRMETHFNHIRLSSVQSLPMSKETKEECFLLFYSILRKVDFLKNSSYHLVSALTKSIVSMSWEKGHVFLKEGEPCEKMAYFIFKGNVDISMKQNVILSLSEGSHFGELSLLLTQRTNNVTVTATKDCDGFYLDKKSFMEVLDNFPQDKSFLLSYVQSKVIGPSISDVMSQNIIVI